MDSEKQQRDLRERINQVKNTGFKVRVNPTELLLSGCVKSDAGELFIGYVGDLPETIMPETVFNWGNIGHWVGDTSVEKLEDSLTKAGSSALGLEKLERFNPANMELHHIYDHRNTVHYYFVLPKREFIRNKRD